MQAARDIDIVGIVGCHQPVGIGLMDNVIKEAGEEAAVPPGLAATARPVGAISYCHESDDGLKPDVMFVYDLELSRDFVPRNTEGEIAEFCLLPAAEVMEITAETQDFKFNCAVARAEASETCCSRIR